MTFRAPTLTLRRVLALGAIFVVAAAATLAGIVSRPTSYQASGSVFLTRLYPPAASATDYAFEASQFVAAVKLDGPVQATAQRTAMSAKSIKTVTATQEGQGAVVDLSLSLPGPSSATSVLQALTTYTAGYLAQQDAESAQVGQLSADRALQNASAALSSFNASVGYGDLSQASQLAVQVAQAAQKAMTASPTSATLQAQLSSRQQQAATATAQLNRQAQLQSAVTQAEAALTSAQQSAAKAQTELTAATASNLLVVNNVIGAGRVSLLGRGLVGVAVAVGLLGFLVLGLVDSRRTRRTAGPASVPTEPRELARRDGGGRGGPSAARRAAAASGRPASEPADGMGSEDDSWVASVVRVDPLGDWLQLPDWQLAPSDRGAGKSPDRA